MQPFGFGKFGIDRRGEKRPPEPGNACQHDCTTAIDEGDVQARDRQDVAEQETHEVDPYPGHERHHDQSQSERGMREDPEQCVGRQRAPAFEQQQCDGDKAGHDEHADHQIELEQEGQRHAKQGRMRHRVTEVSHTPPHDETTERSGNRSKPYAGDKRAGEEIVKHDRRVPCDRGDARRPDGSDR